MELPAAVGSKTREHEGRKGRNVFHFLTIENDGVVVVWQMKEE